jgi:hypothetical protein
MEKSKGDPPYVKFLAEDIYNGYITEENIVKIPTGLEEYLQQELENLEKRAHGELAIILITIISSNDCPWPEEDLFQILKKDHSNITRTILRNQVIPSVRRYLYQVSLGKDRLGDEKLGYTIIHPRLKKYFDRMLKYDELETI